MINSVKARTPILALILFVFAVGYTYAETKVVVIPLGADAAPVPTTQWALVQGSDGAVIVQSGGISASRIGEGAYFVNFGEDVTGHAVMTSSQEHSARTIRVKICGGSSAVSDPETVICTNPHNHTNYVLVYTRNSSGTNADGNFYITVLP